MMNEISNTKEGNKKISIILVLRALEECSDREHPIRQVHLARMVNALGEEMDIPLHCDRKTIARNLKVLEVAGYNIVKVEGKGVYLEDNNFSARERNLLCYIIRKSTIADTDKQLLITKLNSQNTQVTTKRSEWKKIIKD